MKILSSRRLAAALIAPALTIGAVTAASSAQASPPQRTPSESAAAAWLAAQPDPSTHLFESVYGSEESEHFTDYGLNLDIYAALSKLGSANAAEAVYQATLAHADDYTDAYGTRYSGAMGKLAAMVQRHGDDATSVGGRNLVTELQDLVVTSGDQTGRALDEPAGQYESSNTIGQAWVVRALATAGSALKDETVEFLLKQQCSDGSFRLQMSGTACTSGTVSVDATAFAVQALEIAQAKGSTGVQDDIDAAAAWLVAHQDADGSFQDEGAANANSTGLAAAVLRSTDHAGAAASAAGWVLAHQVAGGSEAGAIAPNDADLALAGRSGIATLDRDRFVRATVQASLGQDALLPDTSIAITSAPRFTQTGKKLTVFAGGYAVGEKVIFSMRGSDSVQRTANSGGRATATFVPVASGLRGITVRGSTPGRAGSTKTTVLGARTLRTTVKYSTVKRGKSQQVIVTGLASGEPVRIGYAGSWVARGTARGDGTFAAYFKVGASAGTKTAAVHGAFSTRTGRTSFRVK